MAIVRIWLCLAGVSGAAAVGLGAYGAHGFGARLDAILKESGFRGPPISAEEMENWRAARIANWDTAVRYHLAHTLAIAIIGIGAARWPMRRWHVAAGAFVVGIALFSGLLYLQAATTVSGLGLGVMAGGITLIAGWLAFAAAALGIRCEKPGPN